VVSQAVYQELIGRLTGRLIRNPEIPKTPCAPELAFLDAANEHGELPLNFRDERLHLVLFTFGLEQDAPVGEIANGAGDIVAMRSAEHGVSEADTLHAAAKPAFFVKDLGAHFVFS